MAGIFISYRRDDERHAAGRLADELAGVFGPENLFRDIESIAPGQDFEVALNTALASCAAMLVVIGRRWLDITDAQGRRRLLQDGDWVRTEVATALQRGIPVIPVLLEGTPLPRAEELPADLQPLRKRRTLELADTRWPRDVEQIVDALLKVPGLQRRMAQPASGSAAATARPAPRKKAAAGTAASSAKARPDERSTAAPAGGGTRWGFGLAAASAVAVLVALNWDDLRRLFAAAPPTQDTSPPAVLVQVPRTLTPAAPAASAPRLAALPPGVGTKVTKPAAGGSGLSGSWRWERSPGEGYTVVLQQQGEVIQGQLLQGTRAAGTVRGAYNGFRADVTLRLERPSGPTLYAECQLLRYTQEPTLGGDCDWLGQRQFTLWKRAAP